MQELLLRAVGAASIICCVPAPRPLCLWTTQRLVGLHVRATRVPKKENYFL